MYYALLFQYFSFVPQQFTPFLRHGLQYNKKGLPFSMRDPNDPERRPLVILPVRYLDKVKWIPENRMSFWKHIDKVCTAEIMQSPHIDIDHITFSSNLSSLKSADLGLLKRLPLPQDRVLTGLLVSL